MAITLVRETLEKMWKDGWKELQEKILASA